MKNKKILLANSLLVLALFLYILIPILADKVFNLKGVISANSSLLLSGFASVVALGGISLLYCIVTKRKFGIVMKLKKLTSRQVITIMFLSIGTYIFAIGINFISMKLFPVVKGDSQRITDMLTSSSTLLGLLVVVFVAAIFEESFFRGVLLDAYEGVNKKIKYFILVLIFATFHGNVMQIIYVMFLGLILLKVREYTGSLLGSITLHAVNNAISFGLSKVGAYALKIQQEAVKSGAMDAKKAVNATDAANISLSQTLVTAIILFIIGGSILYLNLRKLKKYRDEKERFVLVEEETLGLVKEEISDIKDENLMNVVKYIPLVIYFIVITLITVQMYH